METFTIRSGDTKPLVVQPYEPDGGIPDLTGASAQIRIALGNACLNIDGVVAGDAFEFDLSQLDLPPRLYRASVYFDWGNGWEYGDDFALHIQGGC